MSRATVYRALADDSGNRDRGWLFLGASVSEEGIAVRLTLGLFRPRSEAPNLVLVHLRVFFVPDRVNQVGVQTMLRQPVATPHLVKRERNQ